MKKILIVYDSPAGSTAKAGEIIKKYFMRKELDVDCISVNNASGLSGYDFVIIGSPVLYGKVSSPIKNYIRKNSEAFSEIPHALFLTCMRLTECSDVHLPVQCYRDAAFNEQKKNENEMSSMEKSHSLQYYLNNTMLISTNLDPVNVAFIKGNLNFKRLKFFSRLVMKIMAKLQDEVNEGDFLDRAAVEQWAESLIDELNISKGGSK